MQSNFTLFSDNSFFDDFAIVPGAVTPNVVPSIFPFFIVDNMSSFVGGCSYAKLDDGKLLNTLSRTDIVKHYKILGERGHVSESELGSKRSDAMSVLDSVDANGKHHALIDTGAVITGKTNLQVADYLLFQRYSLIGFK